MATVGTAPAARELSGRGEAVLHNLKNWGCAIELRHTASSDGTSPREMQAFGDATCRLFDAARRISERSATDGYLSADTPARLGRLLKEHDEVACALRDGEAGYAASAGLAAFLRAQYEEHGLLLDILNGETVCLSSAMPLTPVERALRKVVQALAPADWMREGRLVWRDDDSGKVLCMTRSGSDAVLRLGIVVTPTELAPRDLSRVLAGGTAIP